VWKRGRKTFEQRRR
jgi:hypothetical protein